VEVMEAAGASARCFLALQRPLSLKAGVYTTGSFVLPEHVFQRDYVSYWTGVEVLHHHFIN